jgi:hypothetical protein
MVFSRRKVIAASILAAAVAFSLVAQVGASDPGQGAPKLEGAWIARVTSLRGQPFTDVSQWTYVLSPDASGRNASIHGTIDIPFGPSQPMNVAYNTTFLDEVVQTGPDTASFNAYWYNVKQGGAGALNQILSIGRIWGEVMFVAPGKSEVTDHFEIYLPSADADGDGIPDEGSSPIASFLVTTQDTRIPPAVR